MTSWVLPIALALIMARWAAQLWLDALNRREVLANKDAVPEAFKVSIDEATYARSVDYTLVQNRFDGVAATFDVVVLAIVLLSGALPRGMREFSGWLGSSAWAMAAFLFAVGLMLSLPGLPLSWYSQFRIEERFGFNATTQRLWWMDRIKGLLLATALGYPLLVLVLKLVEWTGTLWWLWAWGCLLAFQIVMIVLAPVLIMPLFNEFTPLPEGSLRERLLALGQRTGFVSKAVQVMDGSRRSRHSNAFFTGFGRFRKIVLFDTLIQQLSELEVEAVLAHEIGHCKLRHIPKMLVATAVGSLAAFWCIGLLARQEWLFKGFGFESGGTAPALLMFGLLAGAVTFWISPVVNAWSRRFEYQADAFAAKVMKETASITCALRKLNEKNLGNLTPHPIYSGFHYSHPTLVERERALANVASLQLAPTGR